MNSKAINFIKSFSYTLTANIITMVTSALITLVVPKLIGVEEYGYWQLYLFYSSYVGFLHFGWNDGIYLRYGGKEYKELDKGLFFSQFYMLVILQLMILILIFGVFSIFDIDDNKLFILKMTALCMLIVNVRYMLLYILLGTNRINEYAQISMLDRMLYGCIIAVFLLLNVREYKLMIIADLIGKFISLLYAMICCKDIVFRKISTFYFSFKEAMNNISVGIKLMFANIASMLIIGVVRFGIERSWNVETFGRISLTLSLSNIMMIFINAIGIIMFPILRRTDDRKLPAIYIMLRDLLMMVLYGALLVYYPIKVVLTAWLPKYAESLLYMALVFPICVYEGKMALLINTYLKTLRKEKSMLKINLLSLALSFVITLITIFILRNLDLSIVSIVMILVIRCILAEILLSRSLRMSFYKDIILELTMTLVFILTGWFINSWLTVVLYALAYFMYLIKKKKDITNTIKNIKLLVEV